MGHSITFFSLREAPLPALTPLDGALHRFRDVLEDGHVLPPGQVRYVHPGAVVVLHGVQRQLQTGDRDVKICTGAYPASDLRIFSIVLVTIVIIIEKVKFYNSFAFIP